MNLFDLFAKITLDDSDFNRKLGAAGGAIAKFGDAAGKGLKAAAKVTAVGATAAAGAVTALGKAAVEGYAEYEQLAGGVETLFKDSANTIMDYASGAYKTAGMSANEYMSTVTSFSASLLQSLGGDTVKAAEYADRAVTDMADNANKMGTDIEMIQNAYQGFAKANYTMLDNLKLGYGGTQSEMERLIQGAAAMTDVQEKLGITVDASSLSFGNIVNAINVMQTSMGIAGATAQEAEGTISGSAASMKAAWTNLVTGMADENANVDELLDQFLESVEIFGGNLLPKIGTVLESVGEALEENGPEMVAQGVVMLAKLALGIVKAIPTVAGKIPEIIRAIVDEFREQGPELKEIGGDILEGIWDGISDKVEWLKGKVAGVVDKIKSWFTGKEGFDEHSPSKWSEKVFQRVMEGGGIGLEKGVSPLLDEVRSVTDRVKDSMELDTATVDFASSGTGISTASMMNGLLSTLRPGEGGTYTFNLMLPNGTVLASYLLGPLAEYAKANGTPILNPN